MKNTTTPLATLIAVLVGLTLGAHSAQAAITLFADTFEDTSTTPANDPNGITNTSVSGTYANSGSANYSFATDTVGASGSASESSGVLTLNGGGSSASVVLSSLQNYALDANVQSSGILTVALTDIAPGSSAWTALNIMSKIPVDADLNGNSPGVNASYTQLGALFGNTGAVQVFSQGSGGAIVPTWSDNDITYALTNITGFGTASGSFDYDILSGVVSLDSGTVTGVDLLTGGLYVGMEGRDVAHTIGALEITTVPEPSTSVILLLGIAGLTFVRRR